MSRKELEQTVLELQQDFVRLEEINQESDSKPPGEQAEIYVAEQVNGTWCGRDSRHCDVVSASRHKLEVKFSNLVSPNAGGAPLSRVWKWIRLFGENRGKVYDRLILTGEPTQQAKDEDRRNGREPRRYELFDLSFEEVQSLLQEIGFGQLSINTDPRTVRAPRGRFVWEHHIELEELVQRYSMEKKPSSKDGSGESPCPAEIVFWGTTGTLYAA